MNPLRMIPRYLFLLSLSIASLSLLALVGVTKYAPQTTTIAQVPEHFQAAPQEKVLGLNVGSMSISSAQSGETNGGVIVLSAAESPVINISSYEINGMAQFSIYPVSKADLLNFLIYRRKPDAESYPPNERVFQVDESTLSGKKTFEQQIRSSQPSNQTNSISLPIEGTGIWYFKGSVDGKTVESMVVRSNLGAIVHKGDNENVFWVQDTTYQSVADVQVETYNTENVLSKLDTLVTNQDGLATNAVNGASDFALLTKGNDLTILPINLQNLGYRQRAFTRWSWSFSKRDPGLNTFLFTDRFLYKPGDTIYFKDIIRIDDDANYSIPSRTLTASFGNYQHPIVEKNLIVSADGNIDGSFIIPKDIKAGFYSISISDGDTAISGIDLQVANFRKPDSTISVKSDKLMYFPGEQMQLSFAGETFIGQPLAGATVRYKVYSSKASIAGDYTTIQYVQGLSSYRPDSAADSTGEATLDANGMATISIPVSNATGYRQFWSIHAEYLDQSGNATNDAMQALVQPADFSLESGANNSQFLVGKPANYPVKVVKNKAEAQIAGVAVQAALFMYNDGGNYTLEQENLEGKSDANGTVQFLITPKQKRGYRLDLLSKDIHGNPSKAEFSLYATDVLSQSQDQDLFTITTDKPSYEIGETAKISIKTLPTVKNVFVSVGRSYSREHRSLPVLDGLASFETLITEKYQPNVYVDVGSFSKDQWRNKQQKILVNLDDKKVKISITPSKSSYAPGEKASFAIQANDGKGRPIQTDLAFWAFDKSLLTMHGNYFEGIFERFWAERYYSIPTNYSYQGIVNQGAEGGGGCFTGDTLIAMADGSQKAISQVHTGDRIRTFSSLTTKAQTDAAVVGTHAVAVDGYLILNTSLHLTPEHKLLINGQWKTAAEAVVGDTLLTQAGESVPITSIEWIRSKTTVYNLSIEKFHTFFAGGIFVHNDKGGSRSIFKDTAYWNPHVQTDASGKATVSFVLPDNLTTWVSAAVSANLTTQVGDGKAEFQVSKDIVTSPITPQFLRVGDNTVLSALVHNYTSASHEFSIAGSFAGKPLTGSATQATIGSKGVGQYFWPLTVPATPGEVIFGVAIKDSVTPSVGDSVVTKIPIYAYGSWMSSFAKLENSGVLPLGVSAGTEASKASGVLTLSALRFPGLQALLDDQMRASQYGSIEQATSTLIAASILKTQGSALGLVSTPEGLDRAVSIAVKNLKSRREGKIWQTDSAFSMSQTRVAIEGLAKAKEAGFAFDETILTDAVSFVRDYSTTRPVEVIDQQYIFSLFPLGQFDRKAINFTNVSNIDDIARGTIANARQGFTNSTVEANALLAAAKETPTQFSWYRNLNIWAPIQNVSIPTVWGARAMLELKLDPALVAKSLEYLYRNDVSDDQSSPHMALATLGYYARMGEANPQLTYQVFQGATVLKSGTLSANAPSATIALSAAQLSSGEALRIESTGRGKLFSRLEKKEYFTDRNLTAEDHNLVLERTYKMSKSSDAPLAPGDLVTVHFHVTGLGQGETSVQIEDYVPAGLVAIDETLDNGNFDTNPDGDGSSQEITQEGMKLTFSAFNTNSHDFSYKTRVINAGEFYAPPATVRLLNDPSIWARSSATVLRVDGKNSLENLMSSKSPLRYDELGTAANKGIIKWLVIAGASIVALAGLIFGYIRRDAIIARLQRKPHASEPPSTPEA